MANFNTHLSVAALGGGLVALSGHALGVMDLDAAFTAWLLTTLGGLLPDIDSKSSKVVTWLFTALALITVLLLFEAVRTWPLWQQAMILSAAFVSVAYGAKQVFSRFTAHRGIFHSLLAGALFALLQVLGAYYILALEAVAAWWQGAAVFIGFTIHLLLDEIYSVDLTNIRIKRSFGTALKLWDYRRPLNSIFLLLIVAALAWHAPSPQGFWGQLQSVWQLVQS
ncbi:LexA-binding, inner membrane-associated putative hydrolase [Allopseudospirillum japonicum]|uniref:LexA-binding, inner membrane-associated putative hydrolase n=1 Tax=Allopseudospirillum japonicum TaxID=64971 RepID=A0A1H6QZ66_9GAMM|nr:metal-dependent hydrolase [Allopseudospirillum japonicum]SEI44760.1 LexA-binding, inner membrane-associated putative hydrolase [Allopseudospirillum japonicum]